MDRKYTLQDFLKIIDSLRSEGGCPWDREQTHESLKPCVMEEAAELVSSIRIYNQTGNYENMREELGDLLLQVAMHSRIAQEEGYFTWEDVVNEISEKMVRRHPHVFGETKVTDSQEVLKNWDEIKKKEKEGKEWIASPLQEIPKELPSLTRASKVLKKIDKVYKPQDTFQESLHNLEQSVGKLKLITEKEHENTSEILGNMLLSISNISRIFKIPQEQVLMDKIEDLIDFYESREKK